MSNVISFPGSGKPDLFKQQQEDNIAVLSQTMFNQFDTYIEKAVAEGREDETISDFEPVNMALGYFNLVSSMLFDPMETMFGQFIRELLNDQGIEIGQAYGGYWVIAIDIGEDSDDE